MERWRGEEGCRWVVSPSENGEERGGSGGFEGEGRKKKERWERGLAATSTWWRVPPENEEATGEETGREKAKRSPVAAVVSSPAAAGGAHRLLVR